MRVRYFNAKIIIFFMATMFLVNLTKVEYSYAIEIPHNIKDLGKPEIVDRVQRENSSYAIADRYIRLHQENNMVAGIFTLYFGVGLIPLSVLLITESTNCTPYGREYHRAIKLKALIIASSDQYVQGNDPLLVSEKVLEDRKETYDYSNKIFNKFYEKLRTEYQADEVKQIIYRANSTGLLLARSLRKSMFKSDSFAPLRWVIETRQLEDRVEKLEAIIAERDEKINKIHDTLTGNTALKELLPHSELLNSNLTDGLYPTLQDKIMNIKDFTFNYDSKRRNGYKRI